MARIIRMLQDEEGVTSIEYALIAALLAMAILTAVTALGTTVATNYSNIAVDVAEAVN